MAAVVAVAAVVAEPDNDIPPSPSQQAAGIGGSQTIQQVHHHQLVVDSCGRRLSGRCRSWVVGLLLGGLRLGCLVRDFVRRCCGGGRCRWLARRARFRSGCCLCWRRRRIRLFLGPVWGVVGRVSLCSSNKFSAILYFPESQKLTCRSLRRRISRQNNGRALNKRGYQQAYHMHVEAHAYHFCEILWAEVLVGSLVTFLQDYASASCAALQRRFSSALQRRAQLDFVP